MALLTLLRRHSGPRLARLSLLSGIAGIGNALVMAVTSDVIATGPADLRRLLLFVLAILVYAVAERAVVSGSAREIEQIVHALRMELLDRIRAASIAALGQLQPAEAYAAVTRDSQAISQAATALTLAAQAALLLLCTLLYLLWISPLEFAVLAALGLVLAGFAIARGRQDRRARDAAIGQERQLLADIGDLLDGFKEAKASPRRATAQLAAIAAGSGATAQAKAAVDGKAAAGAVAVQACVYLALALLVFGLPLVAELDPAAQRQTVTALLFAAGSIGLLVQGMPVLAAADEAAGSLARLADRLPPEQAGQAPLPGGRTEIALRGAAFAWRDPAGRPLFQVGPLDLRLAAGEVVFITGGNGSGKSTLLRMLAGLLPVQHGLLLCNGVAVTAANRQSYRDRVGSIFADQHLFRRPYGTPGDPDRIAALLAAFGLAGKVALRPDGAWDGLGLSGGQRKRLAMVLLLLEAPALVILDEWAADQDPGFRRRFYEELLPDLRARGCAVLCATHDDRYFGAADRCYTLRDGRLHPTALHRAERHPEDPA